MLFGRLRVPSAGISVCFLVQVSAYSSLIFGIEKNLDGMIGGLDIQEILAVSEKAESGADGKWEITIQVRRLPSHRWRAG